MTILVFGQTGQVGSELSRLPDVHCLGREQADLTSPQECAEMVHKFDGSAIINAAAYTAVDRAEEEENLATIINGDTVVAMAQAAAEKNLPFVHISTDYVFSGEGENPIQPDEKTNPINAYGRSKLIGELALAASSGPWAVLRTSWVFSAHGNNFVKTMLRLGETRKELNVVSDQWGGPTPARAIAQACVSMANALVIYPEKSGIYHFSGQKNTNWANFARTIFELAQMDVIVNDIPSSAYPTAAGRPFNSRLDCSTLNQTFGITQPNWKSHLAGIIENTQRTEQ